jgi:flagellar biogenesis protein FliO
LASHEQPAPLTEAATTQSDPRRLAPPRLTRPPDAAAKKATSLLDRFNISRGSTSAVFAAVAIVSGLLLLLLWGLKRSLPQSMQLLPSDAAQVIGRMHLTGKNFAHLIKLGDRLVLVSITPTGVDTIAEVTHPDEVTRLLALCSAGIHQSGKHHFDHILQQLASEPTGRAFLGADTLAPATRGGFRHA